MHNRLKNMVEIVGKADPKTFPSKDDLLAYHQFMEKDIMVVPQRKPDIEQLFKVMVEPVIESYKIIETPIGLKIVIEGIKLQKLFYVADCPQQSVHAAEYEFGFCTFIQLPKNITYGEAKKLVPQIIVEDVCVKMVDCRTVEKHLLLFAYVTKPE